MLPFFSTNCRGMIKAGQNIVSDQWEIGFRQKVETLPSAVRSLRIHTKENVKVVQRGMRQPVWSKKTKE